MKKLLFGGILLASMILGSLSLFAEGVGGDQVDQTKLCLPELDEWCDDPGYNCVAGEAEVIASPL